MEVEGQRSRALSEQERALILALLPNDNAITSNLENAHVLDLEDGGMGSIRFIRNGTRRRSSAVGEARYFDEDGVVVSIEVSVDERGELFELDFWKVDFSPLRRYPRPQDLLVPK